MTKRDKILRHLQRYGWITSWIGITKYRSTRVADDIYWLNKRAQIKTRTVLIKSGQSRFARYEVIR